MVVGVEVGGWEEGGWGGEGGSGGRVEWGGLGGVEERGVEGGGGGAPREKPIPKLILLHPLILFTEVVHQRPDGGQQPAP